MSKTHDYTARLICRQHGRWVTIAGQKHASLAARLHDRAHELCFLANSCSVPIVHEATYAGSGRLRKSSEIASVSISINIEHRCPKAARQLQ